jgi:hypothetical protein
MVFKETAFYAAVTFLLATCSKSSSCESGFHFTEQQKLAGVRSGEQDG